MEENILKTKYRNIKTRNNNKLWVSLLTTIGLSTALFALQKYKNGKFLKPVQNVMETVTSMRPASNLAPAQMATEFSKEIIPKVLNQNENNAPKGNQQQQFGKNQNH